MKIKNYLIKALLSLNAEKVWPDSIVLLLAPSNFQNTLEYNRAEHFVSKVENFDFSSNHTNYYTTACLSYASPIGLQFILPIILKNFLSGLYELDWSFIDSFTYMFNPSSGAHYDKLVKMMANLTENEAEIIELSFIKIGMMYLPDRKDLDDLIEIFVSLNASLENIETMI